MRAPSLFFIGLLIAGPLACSLFAQPILTQTDLLVFKDGFVEVFCLVQLEGDVLVELPLAGEPEGGFVFVVDEEGVPLDYNLTENQTLLVESLGSTHLEVIYHTNSITSKLGEVWTVNFSAMAGSTCLTIPENSIVVGLSDVPDSITTRENATTLEFGGASQIWVSYVLSLSPSPPPLTPPQAPSSLRYLIPLAAGLGALLSLFALRLRSRRVRVDLRELSYVDRLLLDELRKRGGEAYQAELAKGLGLPKTTAWRHIRSLERLGLIEVSKVEEMNYIKLK